MELLPWHARNLNIPTTPLSSLEGLLGYHHNSNESLLNKNENQGVKAPSLFTATPDQEIPVSQEGVGKGWTRDAVDAAMALTNMAAMVVTRANAIKSTTTSQ